MSVSRYNASVFICEYVFDYGLSTWLDRPMIPEKVVAEKECFDVDREVLDRLPTGKNEKEIDKCTVFKIQDSKEYSIKILNHDGRRVCADVFVDGNLIGKFAVEPFSSVTVRRPVDSEEGTMLTFNNRSKSNDDKQMIDPHLGHVRVKVTPELNIHPKVPLFATEDDEVMECIDNPHVVRPIEPVSPLGTEENATSGRPIKTRQQFVKSKPFWRGSLFETTIKIFLVPSS